MPTFKYRAKDDVKDVEGMVEAASHDEAVDKVHQMGYLPVRVEEAEQAAVASPQKGKRQPKKSVLSRIRKKDIILFYRQLASLTRSGVPILRSLTVIGEQSENAALKDILEKIHAQVKEGDSLSEALTQYPKVFSPLDIAMLRGGEKGGAVAEVLGRVAAHLEKQEEILSRIRSAFIYPILMAVVGAGTIFFMLVFVMPRLMRVFSRTGQELPLATKILLNTSAGLQQWWPWIVIGIAVLIFVLKQGMKGKAQQMFLSRLKLKLPVLGEFTRKAELARFNRTLELLVKSNIPLMQAIEVAIPVINNEDIKEELRRGHEDLKGGDSFGKSLERSSLFPPLMTNLIVVGEESGRLADALSEVATAYERELDETVKVMTALLEPLMILIMGLIVGFIVVAMLLPIFQMNMAIQ